MSVWQKPRTRLWIIFVLMLTLAPVALQSVQAQGEWEMKVCADPQNFPFSSQAQPGFENRIAELIAEELQAELTYTWARSEAAMVRNYLRTGECDLVMGVAEGTMGLLNTVPFYRAPYVFVYRKDSELDIHSLNDEILHDLRISTYPASPIDRALINRGLRDNLVAYPPVTGTRGADRDTPILEAVINGEVDVAILYGPIAGHYAQHQTDELYVVAVSPEIEPPMTPMFRISTIGVRPGDEALRDRLNIALAQKWDDIQAVFDEYGIPLLPVSRPTAPQPEQAEILRIGAILPLRTGNPSLTDTIGEAARVGARIAEDLIGRSADRPQFNSAVSFASSPSADAAFRAAQRLVVTEGVTALIGGFGEEQALALRNVAKERNVLFFNIGDTTDALRNEECQSTMFHIEASAAMYLDALATWFISLDHHRWFFVYEQSDEGRALYRRAVEAITALGEAEEVGQAGVDPNQFVYHEVLEQIREAAPEVVLLLLNPEDQEFFLGQYEFTGLKAPITGIAHPVMQTRDFFARLRQVAPQAGAGYRVALWETTLEEGGAGEINERFMSRTGEPMDPSGWAAYAAVKILSEAVAAAGTLDVPALIDYLKSPEATFDLGKRVELSFRSWDHQLRQPLYLVKIDPEAEWGVTVSRRVALGQLIDELPVLNSGDGALEQLDLLGDGPEASSCSF